MSKATKKRVAAERADNEDLDVKTATTTNKRAKKAAAKAAEYDSDAADVKLDGSGPISVMLA